MVARYASAVSVEDGAVARIMAVIGNILVLLALGVFLWAVVGLIRVVPQFKIASQAPSTRRLAKSALSALS